MDRFGSMSRDGARLVAVLPGSRNHEVDRNWPLMLESIRRLHRQHPDAIFLVASYRDRQCLRCRDLLSPEDRSLPIEFFVDRTSEIIEASHFAMMVSGSVSLSIHLTILWRNLSSSANAWNIQKLTAVTMGRSPKPIRRTVRTGRNRLRSPLMRGTIRRNASLTVMTKNRSVSTTNVRS